MSNKIFIFGCWNKNSCLDGDIINGRSEVINLLSNEPTDYDMGILLGDNIYPLKQKIQRGHRHFTIYAAQYSVMTF